jgi:hypothetical protein
MGWSGLPRLGSGGGCERSRYACGVTEVRFSGRSWDGGAIDKASADTVHSALG